MAFFMIIVFVLAGVFVVGTAIYFNQKAVYPHNWQYEETFQKEFEKGLIGERYFESLDKESVEIESEDNLKIVGYWIKGTSNKTIVISHGITNNYVRSLKYLEPFLSRGYNAVVYDHRNHGKSEGDYTTFGYEEKKDLKKVIDYVQKRIGKEGIIGTHGESMGAATVLQHAAMDSRVDFIISDCSFSSAESIFAHRLSVENHLPAFPFLQVASFINKLRRGIWFSEMSPLAVIGKVHQPVLFIHGLADDYVPSRHTQILYDLKPEPKMLYLVEGARHASSIYVNHEKYLETITVFLDKYGF